MSIQKRLFAVQDKAYASFQSKLVPTLPADCFIGVRMPEARKLARSLHGTQEVAEFMADLPHYYYEENILQVLLISQIQDFGKCLTEVERFLPYIDNWAVCDALTPKVFRKHRQDLLAHIKVWLASDKTYTCRFGLKCIMDYYLDEGFSQEYLDLAAAVRPDEYYVQMAQAWLFATALAKQWEATLPYIEEQRLTPEVHRKTLQKARESLRISAEQNAHLSQFKLKRENDRKS